jgi:hypothetical protein
MRGTWCRPPGLAGSVLSQVPNCEAPGATIFSGCSSFSLLPAVVVLPSPCTWVHPSSVVVLTSPGAWATRHQGLKPTDFIDIIGTTEVVPCYKTSSIRWFVTSTGWGRKCVYHYAI